MSWLDSKEAAAYARVSRNTILDAAQAGDLSGCKVKPESLRSTWRFKAEDIDAWLERGRVDGTRRPRRRVA